jgi:hypothetical protein
LCMRPKRREKLGRDGGSCLIVGRMRRRFEMMDTEGMQMIRDRRRNLK